MIKQVMPFVVGLFLCSSVYAQVPKQINYQGIARNAYGAPLTNQTVTVRVSIHDGSATGIVVYSERRSVTTNQFGLFSTAIGSEGASNITGTLAGVDWSSAQQKFVEIEMDPRGGTNFVSLGSSPLTSVPFAFRAESANPIGVAGGDLAGSFPNPTLKDGAVTAAKLAAGSVGSDKIADGSITAAKLAPGVISGGGASGVAGGDLTGNYPSPIIASSAVNTSKIADNAITTAKVADGSITAAKLAPGVIPTIPGSLPPSGSAGGDLSGSYPAPVVDKLKGITLAGTTPTNGQVLKFNGTQWAPANETAGSGGAPTGAAAGDLAGTYPNPTIAGNAVTTVKIADGAVTTAKIADANITGTKLADGSITAAKLASGVIPASLPPSGAASGDLTGTYPSPVVGRLNGVAVAATTPASGQILKFNGTQWAPANETTGSGGAPTGAAGGDLAGAYPNPTVANNAITGAKVADAAIGTTKIADNAITSAKIADGTIAAADLAANAVTTAKIADANITGAKLADGTITAAKLASGVIPASLPPSGTASGDLTGTYPSPVVGRINGVAVAATAPANGQILKFNGTQWAPANETTGGGGAPTGAAGGDLAGTYPNPTVANNAITSVKVADAAIGSTKIADNAITSAKIADGTVAAADLAANAVTTAKIADGNITAAKLASGVIPASLPPSGAATGDLSGTYPAPTVGRLNGIALAATAPTNGQVLKYNGTQWAPAADAGGAPSGTAGGDLGGSYPNPTVGRLNGIALAATAPTNGQVLTYNGSQWAPATATGGSFTIPFTPAPYTQAGPLFSLTNNGAGAALRGVNGSDAALATGVIGIQSATNVHAYGTGSYGAVTGSSNAGGIGVWGMHAGTGTAVLGTTVDGNGLRGESETGVGVNAYSNQGFGLLAGSSNSIAMFVIGQNANPNGDAAILVDALGKGIEVVSNQGNAIEATTGVATKAGVYAESTAQGEAIHGVTAGPAAPAIHGKNNSTGNGVQGTSNDGVGVFALANETALGSGDGTALLAQLNFQSTGNLAVFRIGAATNVARIDNTGRGFFNGGTQMSGADVAEHFAVEGSLNSYAPGDVLEISTSGDRTVVKSSTPYSTLVAGVYATKPGVLLTEENAEANTLSQTGVPMGVIGVIPTKVTLEGGAIKRGDLLVTSSTPGAAMKGDPDKIKVGQVLGKALQDYNGTGKALINVLVSVK